MLRTVLLAVILSTATIASAQITKSLHNTYDLTDIDFVELDLIGEVAVEQWMGNQLMLETQVFVEGLNDTTVKYFLDQGRYNTEAKTDAARLSLVSKEKKVSDYEKIKTVLYIPQGFVFNANQTLTRTDTPSGVQARGN